MYYIIIMYCKIKVKLSNELLHSTICPIVPQYHLVNYIYLTSKHKLNWENEGWMNIVLTYKFHYHTYTINFIIQFKMNIV